MLNSTGLNRTQQNATQHEMLNETHYIELV